MEESILTSIKKLLNISVNDNSFDTDIIININTVFAILNQLGVGPKNGFSIKDNSSVWSDYLEDDLNLDSVKTYIYLKVKMLFDPPTNSSITENYNKLISELEWRINSQVDYILEED